VVQLPGDTRLYRVLVLEEKGVMWSQKSEIRKSEIDLVGLRGAIENRPTMGCCVVFLFNQLETPLAINYLESAAYQYVPQHFPPTCPSLNPPERVPWSVAKSNSPLVPSNACTAPDYSQGLSIVT